MFRDHPDIMRLAADFHRASVYGRYPLAMAKVDQLFQRALFAPDHRAIILADETTDRAEGYLLAICYEHYFSSTLTVSDVGFYVTPEYRTAAAARGMLKKLEAWAWEKGAADIALGVSSGIADEGVIRFYERMGYTRGAHMLVKSR